MTDLLAKGAAYFNVHTSEYPGGEIRGQFRARKEIKNGATGKAEKALLVALVAAFSV